MPDILSEWVIPKQQRDTGKAIATPRHPETQSFAKTCIQDWHVRRSSSPAVGLLLVVTAAPGARIAATRSGGDTAACNRGAKREPPSPPDRMHELSMRLRSAVVCTCCCCKRTTTTPRYRRWSRTSSTVVCLSERSASTDPATHVSRTSREADVACAGQPVPILD